MLELFDITTKEIQKLTDSDLRTLIARLCEAELELKGLPVTAVKWGGDQRAADGGLDVFVDLMSPAPVVSELPRWKTGFQVKQESMPQSKVAKEMAPGGTPRAILTELAQNDGAYIIACGKDSASYSMLKSRLDQMNRVCSNIPASEKLLLDFYDSSRIASWTRKHPGLVLWVKRRLGKQLSGWQPYGNWANCPSGVEEEFLLDEGSKVYDGGNNITEGMPAIEGLLRIRKRLAQAGGCVRLTGLSGVGKTRFTQALFDDRLGTDTLSKSMACYTDTSHQPSPNPRELAVQLQQMNKRVILVVDNCPPDLHEELVKVCSEQDSALSLITIEYDIREDRPEKTDVFHMEPSSKELLEKLISSRYPAIDKLGSTRIAEFSEGNARIAIAIADTVRDGDTILTLQNNELFNRLFLQRNNADAGLTRAAEVCALVYSFDGENIGSSQNELEILASLSGVTATELYRHVNELCRRGLAQKRGQWRAILPHAIANRLATQALENYPIPFIIKILQKDPSLRLIKSFSRRLSYLHDVKAAQRVAKDWLRPEGLLGDTVHLTDLDIALLNNIAPVMPEKALEALERAAYGPEGDTYASRTNRHYSELTGLIRQIAYDANLFERCCKLLLKFCATEKIGENYNSIRNLTASLFLARLSGTCATVDQRLAVLAECISEGSANASMAVPILDNLLEAHYFRSFYGFEFGARSRGYGLHPKTWGDVTSWYRPVIGFAKNVILNNTAFSMDFKKCLAQHFRSLWTRGNSEDALKEAILEISTKSFWSDGWLAIRRTINFDKEILSKESFNELIALEKKLAPKNLYEETKTYVLTARWKIFDITDTVEENDDNKLSRHEQVASYTEELGKKIANEPSVFKRLLPDLFTKSGNVFNFGKGLAIACKTPSSIWKDLIAAFNISKNKEINCLCGFLTAMYFRNQQWYEVALDDALDNKVLTSIFPYLQCSLEINDKAVERILTSLEKNLAPVNQYDMLSCGKQSCKINDLSLIKILTMISEKENGFKVTLTILSMRLFNEKEYPISKDLINYGQQLSYSMLCDENLDCDEEYEIGVIIERFYSGDKANKAALQLCKKLVSCLENHLVDYDNCRHFINHLIKVQPKIVLTVLLEEYKNGEDLFLWVTCLGHSTILSPSHEVILEWCDEAPDTRYPLISKIAPFFSDDTGSDVNSIPPITEALINRAPEFPAILNNVERSMYPSSWSGSLSATLSQRIPYLEELSKHGNPIVEKWARSALSSLLEKIDQEKNYEEEKDRNKFETFE